MLELRISCHSRILQARNTVQGKRGMTKALADTLLAAGGRRKSLNQEPSINRDSLDVAGAGGL